MLKKLSSFLPIKFSHEIKYLISHPEKPEVMSHQKYRQFFFDKISLSNIPPGIIYLIKHNFNSTSGQTGSHESSKIPPNFS
jgi:hypothetical protein